jgi:hypothetical protein
MKIILENVFNIKSGIVCQQVNCMGVMGAGLALQMRNVYPEVYTSYIKFCRINNPLLGKVLFVPINNQLIIANIFAQNSYKGKYICHTDYEAMIKCLRLVEEKGKDENLQIYFPHRIGCGLAGGSWRKVSSLINQYCPTAIVCKI